MTPLRSKPATNEEKHAVNSVRIEMLEQQVAQQAQFIKHLQVIVSSLETKALIDEQCKQFGIKR